ncbi:hypothetical protein CUC15_05735 [Oceanobacillus zhaokaii]|uniref:Uncharacterized protein n=1 Tax=Oceanobacillus zhaokaii TaxID=2052660 RepID=A0A345PEL8_9BACI|nr:hypothetical protein [Oceanobacillus zhaokaii]AXI08448.1 hypothetical protein CUC15_05735 [Oceanobacillus zhaokaii]
MEKKLVNWLFKWVFVVYFFFVVYILSISISEVIINAILPDQMTYLKVILIIIVAVLLSLIGTMVIHLFNLGFNDHQKFRNRFEVSNLVFIFVTGLLTVLPLLNKSLRINDTSSFIARLINDQEINAIITLVFFIATFNYNIYKPIFFLDDDIKINKIETAINKIQGSNLIRKIIRIVFWVTLVIVIINSIYFFNGLTE